MKIKVEAKLLKILLEDAMFVSLNSRPNDVVDKMLSLECVVLGVVSMEDSRNMSKAEELLRENYPFFSDTQVSQIVEIMEKFSFMERERIAKDKSCT